MSFLSAMNDEIGHMLKRKSLDTMFASLLSVPEGSTIAFVEQYIRRTQTQVSADVCTVTCCDVM